MLALGKIQPPCLSIPQRGSLQRAATIVRAGSEDPWSEPLKKAASFAQKLRNDLPVIGLISKLTTPTGVTEESGLSYQEFARSIYDTIDDEMNNACYEIQEEYGTPGQLRYMLCICWMAKSAFGTIPPKSIMQAAVRLRGSRDLEYEIGQFEALREEEKKKYGFGESVDYSSQNMIPIAVDGLVRLVLGVTENYPVSEEAQERLTAVLMHVFPTARLVDVQDAFQQRSARAYLYV